MCTTHHNPAHLLYSALYTLLQSTPELIAVLTVQLYRIRTFSRTDMFTVRSAESYTFCVPGLICSLFGPRSPTVCVPGLICSLFGPRSPTFCVRGLICSLFGPRSPTFCVPGLICSLFCPRSPTFHVPCHGINTYIENSLTPCFVKSPEKID